ncbi:uncharacterized protein TNCV_3775361 [Trichonephila clavipes]|nr:uncharacterized protein TNCV_3775361 [Trichonephila clavipes]
MAFRPRRGALPGEKRPDDALRPFRPGIPAAQVELGKRSTKTYDMMNTAFGDETMSRARVFEWFRRFKESRQSVNSDPNCGRPSTSYNEDKIAQVKDLDMLRVSAKFVQRLLTDDQQFLRLTTLSDLFQSASDDLEFMKFIITGDESWVYGYDPETKQQSSQWKTPGCPGPKKARQVRSKIKVMLIVFFDTDGIVHHEYAPQGQAVNKELYLNVMKS